MLRNFVALSNTILLLKNPMLAVQLSKGAYNWRPMRSLNFIVKKGRLISKIDETTFDVKHFKKFHYSLVNIYSGIENYTFSESGEDLLFSPKKYPELSFRLCNYDNIIAADEIFYNSAYNIETEGPLTVFDVGANVGIATAFFAKLPFVTKVISFEPFAGTYSNAVENIKLNHLTNVELQNVGWGDRDCEVDVPELEDGFLGASATSFVLEEQKKFYKFSKKHSTIILKQASTLVKSLMDGAENQRYLLKMDCEGAEYEIIEDLNKAKLLRNFTIMIIEWHIKGAAPIVRQLTKAGFSVWEFEQKGFSPMGMIYAFRN
jgi:FkbM family methyltransferase